MKTVTRQRIEKAHQSRDHYYHYLTDKDQPAILAMMHSGLKSLISSGFNQEPSSLEQTKDKLDLTFHDVLTPEYMIATRNRYYRNMARLHRKHDRIDALQIINDVSGLELKDSSIGDGIINHWQQIEDFKLTANDLKLLKGDRLKLLEFWINQVTIQGLKVFQSTENDWKETSLDFIRLASRDYHWGTFWESVSWHEPTPISDDGGVVVNTSNTPVDGWDKVIEIHLGMGNGRDLESTAEYLSFCATNQKCPSI